MTTMKFMMIVMAILKDNGDDDDEKILLSAAPVPALGTLETILGRIQCLGAPSTCTPSHGGGDDHDDGNWDDVDENLDDGPDLNNAVTTL